MLKNVQKFIPPGAALSNPIYTPAGDGTAGFLDDPVHEMAPHVIALVVRVELLNFREAEEFPLTCILRIIVCRVVNKSPFVIIKHCYKIHILVGVRAYINTTCGV